MATEPEVPFLPSSREGRPSLRPQSLRLHAVSCALGAVLVLGFQTCYSRVSVPTSARFGDALEGRPTQMLGRSPSVIDTPANMVVGLSNRAVSPGASGVKAVIFDQGGVLGPDTPWWTILPEVPQAKRAEVLRVAKESWANASVAINYNMEKMWAPIIATAGLSLHWTVYNQRARDSFNLNWEVLGVVHQVKLRGYQLGVISNHIDDWFWHWFNKHALDELWPNLAYVVVSSDAQTKKPAPEIFQYFLDKVGGLQPEECIFIDNTAANLVAPAKLGFRTVLYEYKTEGCTVDATPVDCIEGLRKALIANGVAL